jgi:fatty-acyl-CoA synthase
MSNTLIPRTPSAYEGPLLLKNLLFYPVVNNPNQEIVYRDLYRGTYRQLRQRIARLANVLTGLGVRPGQTVAVMDWDSHRYLELFFAVPMIGAVLHTINVRISPDQILYTVNHAKDDVLLVNRDFLPIVEAMHSRLESVRAYMLLADDGGVPECTVPFVGEYEQLLAAAAPAFDFADFDENTRATTFYTTGTTGMPKGVYFSHRQLVVHTLAAAATFSSAADHGSFRRDDVYMPMTPMFHVHSWGMPYVATLLGVKQVYPGRYTPESLLSLREREGVTLSHCVPTILHMLLRHPMSQGMNLRGWKLIIGGSLMSRSLCIEALGRGMDVYSGYGMSETCPIISLCHLTPAQLLLPIEDQAALRCRLGRPLPLLDLRVVDEQMQDVPGDGNSPGEIVVRAPWATQGYLNDSAASERLWRGGYLHTGDVAILDADGSGRITDRSKDIIKVAGEWLSSLELEDIIMRHPGVVEVAVIGLPDEKWGERPLALVVTKPTEQGPASEKKIVQHVREHVAAELVNKQAVLIKVQFVDAIDKTSVGKIDKVALRKKYLPRA